MISEMFIYKTITQISGRLIIGGTAGQVVVLDLMDSEVEMTLNPVKTDLVRITHFELSLVSLCYVNCSLYWIRTSR